MLSPKLSFFIYRYRFLSLYTVYGLLSLLLELLITDKLISIGFSRVFSNTVGITAGIFFAFFMNMFFNFHIPLRRFFYVLAFFILISLGSFGAQFIIRAVMKNYWPLNAPESRLLVSGIFFLAAYLLHRKLTFRNYKKVGVAVYADEKEPISKIYAQVGNYPSFVHIDIVDESFQPDCVKPAPSRIETIHAWWHSNVIEAHVMTKFPSRYLDALLPYVSVIYLHTGIDEDLPAALDKIRAAGVTPGIALSCDAAIEDVAAALEYTSQILILAISKPGISGQHFQERVFDLVRQINEMPNRNSFDVSVDGGITLEISQQLNVEKIVSASYILNRDNPLERIHHLQTEGKYAANNR